MTPDHNSGTPSGSTTSAQGNRTRLAIDIAKLKKAYTEYLSNKREEIDEQRTRGATTTAHSGPMLRSKSSKRSANSLSPQSTGLVARSTALSAFWNACGRTRRRSRARRDRSRAQTLRPLSSATHWTLQEWKPKSAEIARDGQLKVSAA